ncbi:MAG: efflux RND transporter permease subunit [Gammaproteobacteria bacterium]
MINYWATSVVRYRTLVLVVSAVAFIGFAIGLKKLYFESSTDIWFLKHDPVLKAYNSLQERFGSNDYLVVGVQAAPDKQDILNQETINAIKKITDFLEEHVAVNKVRSINKYEYIHYANDLLRVDPAIPYSKDYRFTESEWSKIREILKNEKIAQGLLFTKDLKNTIISARVVEQKYYTGPDNAKKDLAADFRTFVEKEGLNNSSSYTLYFSGSSIISESFFYFSTLDQSISYPLMMLFILIFLFLIFRTWMGTLLPFCIVIASAIVSLGLVGFSGWSMNMLNIIIPTILTVIALGCSIHILTGFYVKRNTGLSSKEAAVEAVKAYFKPCFYAAFTTILGFLSLTTSKLALVMEFGLEMAVGVLAAFLFSLTTLPAILSFSNMQVRKTSHVADSGLIAQAIRQWPETILKRRKIILLGLAVSILPLLYLCSQVEVDTNFVRNFKEDAPVRQGLQYFDETYKGALSLEFMLDSGKEDGVKDPHFLQRALEFQIYATSMPGTGRATSLTDYLMKINQVMHDDDKAYFKVPDTRNMVGQYLLMYSSSGPDEDLTDLMTFDGRYMRVSVLFEVAPSKITKERVEEIDAYIQKEFSDLNIETTGRAVLFNNMDNYVLDGLTSSFGLAFIIISLCFFILLRSVKYGLIALIPNITPIIVGGAIMGLFNIYLDFATLMIAATTLGIAVDDTIHFMLCYVSLRKEDISNKDAIRRTIYHHGIAIVSTSIVLIFGFSMLMLSSFVPNFYMGVMGCVVIFFALLGDLALLPAILSYDKDKRNEDSETATENNLDNSILMGKSKGNFVHNNQ